jgi:hypothetical protein
LNITPGISEEATNVPGSEKERHSDELAAVAAAAADGADDDDDDDDGIVERDVTR